MVRKGGMLGLTMIYFVLTVFAIISFSPLLWTFITSLKVSKDIFTMPPTWFFKPTLKSYRIVLEEARFRHSIINSIGVVPASVVVSLLFGSLAAYALTRLRVFGGNYIAFFMLATRFIPAAVTIIPLFIMMKRVGLYDTWISLILVYSAMNIPYATWMMRGFFQELSKDVEEAAMLDGCSRLGALMRITLPLCAPGMIATAIICLIFSWNDFFYAFILTGSNAKTLPLAISLYLGEMGVDWGRMTGAGIMVILPTLIFSIVIQKHLAKGLTFGMVK